LGICGILLLIRIRIVQKPTATCVDGIQLDRFKPGRIYEVGSLIGALLLAEGWAEPITFEEPPPIVASSRRKLLRGKHDPAHPANLVRQIYPPYLDRFRRSRPDPARSG
jgi:hypothetical protein